jgi:energy-coupling factor transporter ATP-binding protein EcfA2
MKLVINKFPPITQRCEIDLSKKVILFVGKNNSGKTYLSQLIWGIYNFDDNNYAYEKDLIPINFITQNNLKSEVSFVLKEDVLEKISLNFVKFFKRNSIKEIFKKNLVIDFEIILDLNHSEIKGSGQVSDFGWIDIRKVKNEWILLVKVKDINNNLNNLNRFIELYIIRMCLSENTTYMPSTRLFLPSFYKYIFNTEKILKDNMFENFDKINSKNKSFYAPSYTQPVDKLIKRLIFQLDIQTSKNSYLDLLSTIIEGNISVDKAEEIGMADISYNHKSGENIPMYLSSSMVNQLAMVYLYFKYWYEEKRNFLVLDEPEMNLHPSKKIEVMELLLDFASENKLLIATHSSTLAKSLINYIHLFDLKEKKENIQEFIDENGLDMNLDINLTSNDIGIYAFNGKTIVSYKKDNDSDIHFGTFTEVEELQNKQYDYIMEELDKYDS